jgi:hypothetical protein
MMVPTIHLNGTSKAALMEQISNASAAIEEAFIALCEMTPNGRDYYLQGQDAIHKAVAEHQQRKNKVLVVKAELESLAIAIDER